MTPDAAAGRTPEPPSSSTAPGDDDLAGALRQIVGDRHVLSDPEVTAGYEMDWTGRWSGRARLVVRPADTAEVASVLAACHRAGAAVVPQGGNTGLVGGSVPRGGEVLLSLGRLTTVEPVDTLASQVLVGAGVTLERLQRHAREAGLDFAVDYAARSAATVGGMTATNAGGVHVLRYGAMRAQVAGLEAVLADGTVLERLSGLAKDTAGYDLPELLIGSEGTLAVITRVLVRLVPRLDARATALVAVEGTEAALELLTALRERLPSLEALELFFADGLELVLDHTQASSPFDAEHPAYVLVECADREDPLEPLAAALEAAPSVRDVAVAQDARQREALWALREGHTEAIGAVGVPHKLDVSVPLAQMSRFEEQVRARVEDAAPHARTILFGHVGDGNLHVNVLGPDHEDQAADEAVLRLVAECAGSVSAEHGVGVAKRRWLSLTRSEEEIAAMQAIKGALDPEGLLNPGAVLISL